MVRVLVYAIPVILLVWALVDWVQTPASDVKRLPRPLWFLVILVPIIGPVLWLIGGRRRGSTPPPRRGPAPRPIAPDDDPDFLRKLDEERRREAE